MKIADRVKEKTTTIGTGSYLLAGALKSFQSFANALTDNDETYYVVEDGESWEVGTGTFNATENTISRNMVHASSNDDNLINWTPGEKRIFISAPAVFLSDLGGIATHTQNTDQFLDEGGDNEVSAAQAKAASDHAQGAHAPANAEQNAPIASQGVAQNGTNNTETMTSLRVAQAMAVLVAGIKNNYDASADPTVDDDSDDGYSPGSFWINGDEAFRCVDPAAGAAVWVKTTLTVDELNAVALSGNSDDLTEGATKLLMTIAERDKVGNVPADTEQELSNLETQIANIGDVGLEASAYENAVTWEADYINASPNLAPVTNSNTSPAAINNSELDPNGLQQAWTIPAGATGNTQTNIPIPADTSAYLFSIYVKPLEPGSRFKIGTHGINGVTNAALEFDFDSKTIVNGGPSNWAIVELSGDGFDGVWLFAYKHQNNGAGTLFIDRVDAAAGRCSFWQRRVHKLTDASWYQVSQLKRHWNQQAGSETIIQRMNKVISGWGDSFVQSPLAANGTDTWSSVLARTFGSVRNYDDSNGNAPTGVGGEQTPEVLVRVLAMSQELREARAHIFWAGHNNHHQPEQIKSDLIAMVNSFSHDDFMVIGLTNTASVTDAQKIIIGQLNKDLSALFGSRFVDVMPALLAAGDGSSDDNTDIANNVVPRSLRGDAVHLNPTGQKVAGDLIVQQMKLNKFQDEIVETPVQKTASNKIAFLGDSITLAGGAPDANALFAHGYVAWFLAFTRGYFDYTLNPSLGGWRTSQILSTGLPQVLASDVSWCVVNGGINDVTNGITLAEMSANIDSIIDQLLDADIQPILVVPYGSNQINSDSEAETYIAYVAYLRRKGKSDNRIILSDVAAVINDPSRAYPQPYHMTVHDGVHPSNYGAMLIGRTIADTVNEIISGMYDFDSEPNNPFNVLSFANNANSLMLGNSGTTGNQTTGEVADNFTVTNYPSGSSTCKATKVPRRLDYASWNDGEVVLLGSIRMPSVANNILFNAATAYICITPGTTGASEPTWPYFNGTVDDNGVIWKGIEFPIRRESSTTYSTGTAVLPQLQNINQPIALLCTSSGETASGELVFTARVGEEISDGAATWMVIPLPDGVAGDWQLVDFECDATGAQTTQGPSVYTTNIPLPAGISAGDTVRFAIEVEYDRVSGLRAIDMHYDEKNSSGSTINTVKTSVSSSQYGSLGFNLDGSKMVFVSNPIVLNADTTQVRVFLRTMARKVLARYGRLALHKIGSTLSQSQLDVITDDNDGLITDDSGGAIQNG